MPAGTAETGNGWIARGSRRNPPPGGGRVRNRRQFLLCDGPPAAKHKDRNTRRFGGQLEAAGWGEPEARDLPHHRRQAALLQALLHGRQDLSIPQGLRIDDAAWVKARPGEARREKIAAVEAPEHRTFEPGSDAGDEKSCGSGELRRGTSLNDFVQGSEGEAASR